MSVKTGQAQFIGLGFSRWGERDAGDRLHADLIQAVGSLGEALDGGLEAHGRRSDRQGLDEAAATDVDLPRRRVGHWQQARLVHIENRLQIGGVAQLPRLGVVGVRSVAAIRDRLVDRRGELSHVGSFGRLIGGGRE